MKFELNDIPKGTTLLFSQGAYSDYGVMGLLVALQDIHIQDFINDYLEKNPESKEKYTEHTLGPARLLAELLRCGYLEPLNYTEVHLGEYGEIDPRIWS